MVSLLTKHIYNKLNTKNGLKFQIATPYKHIIIEDFLPENIASDILEEFPKISKEGWIHYLHYNENKHGLNNPKYLPDSIKKITDYFNSDEFIAILSKFTNIPNLIGDNNLEGGGVHQSMRGGKLNIHADFTTHPHHPNWKRRLNILIYFNKNWDEAYNGDLELWDKGMKHCVKKIAPIYNRCVIFATDHDSYHGVPEIIDCPDGETRKSIALYYYTIENEIVHRNATNYKARPNDNSVKRILIWIDKKSVAIYTVLKGLLGLNDQFVSNILKLFHKKR